MRTEKDREKERVWGQRKNRDQESWGGRWVLLCHNKLSSLSAGWGVIPPGYPSILPAMVPRPRHHPLCNACEFHQLPTEPFYFLSSSSLTPLLSILSLSSSFHHQYVCTDSFHIHFSMNMSLCIYATEKKVGPLEVGFQVVLSLRMWVLGPEVRSCRRAGYQVGTTEAFI